MRDIPSKRHNACLSRYLAKSPRSSQTSSALKGRQTNLDPPSIEVIDGSEQSVANIAAKMRKKTETLTFMDSFWFLCVRMAAGLIADAKLWSCDGLDMVALRSNWRCCNLLPDRFLLLPVLEHDEFWSCWRSNSALLVIWFGLLSILLFPTMLHGWYISLRDGGRSIKAWILCDTSLPLISPTVSTVDSVTIRYRALKCPSLL